MALRSGATGAGAATLVGLIAVLMWAVLATLTTLTGAVPPLLLNAMAFAVASVIGLAFVARTNGVGGLARVLRQPWPVWLLGVGGLFGYHAMYFTALRLAPPVEASLIAYLWPLLIVLLSALLPGEPLRANHLLGALVGLAGAVLIVARPGTGGAGFDMAYAPGYLAAFACAFIWSGYSVLSRLAKAVPTQAVAGFCLATAVLSAALHLAFEKTIWPDGAAAWLAVLGLGLGPVGGAFYVWDWGCKRGDIKVLGAASYAAPVLSTLVLIAAGLAEASLAVLAACVLVTLGGVVASWHLLRGRHVHDASALLPRLKHHLVRIAPSPGLAGLDGARDRVARRRMVLGGVAIGRGVAAADMAAGHADPEVHPVVSGLQAFLAAMRGRADRLRSRPHGCSCRGERPA